MLKRLAPAITVLLSFLLDTAVIPMLYTSVYQIPLSLVVVILIGIQLGRFNGMLYGMIAGLLLDISTGSLGLKLFAYILIGFLIGFLLDPMDAPAEKKGKLGRSEQLRIVLVRAVWIAVLFGIYETVLLVYQYFSTAVFEWIYVRNLLVRVLSLTALTSLLYPVFHRIYLGKARNARQRRNTREVKNF